jgi:general secretion pathway protein D
VEDAEPENTAEPEPVAPPANGAEPDQPAPENERPRFAPSERFPGSSDRPQRTRARIGPTPNTAVALPDRGEAPAAEPNLRLNFRGVPLEMVLDYLSDAAGFIIILDTEVKGKVDVWSNQPLNRDEAVDLLNTMLAKNGYTAIRNGRTLTIVSREDAKRRDIPVRSGNDPNDMPKSEEMVTQIIPVRFINAVQLTRDLQPLIPSTATIASNEGGNAVVVTDTQTNIRHLAEIIRALDTAISSVSAVRVFSLKYADAKALATVVRDLFTSTDTSSRGGASGQQQVTRGFQGPGGGFPGFGGRGGNPGGDAASGASGASRVSAPRVVAVADERSNSLVVSAPVEQMSLVEELVQQVDTNVEDVTELRVFRLKNADPQEMADVLASLFPDPTTSNNQNNRGGQLRFGGGPFGGFGGNRQPANDMSTRLQQQSKVTAVPDPRTGSIVVSASRDLMDQIGQMISQLDADPAKKQKVFVYSVENTDPTAVEEILRGLFEGQNSRNRGNNARSNTRQTGNQLNTRATQNQNQGTRNTGFGNNTGGQFGR